MSEIAETGLRAFRKSAAETTINSARAKVEDGRLRRPTPTLPADVAASIEALAEANDERLNGYLAALREAGWSYATLSTPLGVSRQSMFTRLTGVTPDPSGLPLPRGARRNNPVKSTVKKHDWAVWVDRDTYAVAAEHAASLAKPMREVMEDILRAFLAGTLFPSETPTTTTHINDKERQNQ